MIYTSATEYKREMANSTVVKVPALGRGIVILQAKTLYCGQETYDEASFHLYALRTNIVPDYEGSKCIFLIFSFQGSN